MAVNVLPPPPPVSVPEPEAIVQEMPVLRIEAVELRSSPPPAKTPGARSAPAPERVEPLRLPCKPTWRELDGGPAGRMVREICDPKSLDGVPQS